jgi:hypothetical protein
MSGTRRPRSATPIGDGIPASGSGRYSGCRNRHARLSARSRSDIRHRLSRPGGAVAGGFEKFPQPDRRQLQPATPRPEIGNLDRRPSGGPAKWRARGGPGAARHTFAHRGPGADARAPADDRHPRRDHGRAGRRTDAARPARRRPPSAGNAGSRFCRGRRGSDFRHLVDRRRHVGAQQCQSGHRRTRPRQ